MASLQFFFLTVVIVSCSAHPASMKHKLDGSLYKFPFVNRDAWGSRDPILEPTPIGEPVSLVVIHHTYQPGVCLTRTECKRAMRSMQDFHQLTNGWSDIGYKITETQFHRFDPEFEPRTSGCTKEEVIIIKEAAYTYKFPFVNRDAWGSRDPILEPTPIGEPVSLVVIHHTYQPGVCLTRTECKRAMRSMQDFHQLTNGWSDIGYNFAVGGDGSVYEGRGWDVVGAHAVGFNTRSVGIAIIGDFRTELPALVSREAARKLIATGIKLGYISPNYQLTGHRQLGSTECPGDALFNEISTWENFVAVPTLN